MAKPKSGARGVKPAKAERSASKGGGSRVEDAYQAMVRRQREAWKKRPTSDERRKRAREDYRGMLVDAELAATRDGASAEARRIREQMVDEGLEPASPAERRYWRHLEAAKKRVQIIGPPVPAYGKQFKDQEALQKAVREHLGFGHGSNFAEPTEISKEAAQIINRLRVAIDDAIRFVRSPEEDERRLGPGPADQAADLLRKWVDALRGSDIDWLPPVPIGGDLERLIDWWTTHPHEEMRPKTDREMAEIALRAGYFPMVDMRKHPTVADVIAQVRRAVRQIQNGH